MLVQELKLLGQGCGGWAEEMDMGMALELQGEYMQAGYLDSTPAPSPPAPWYQPHPQHLTTHLPGAPPCAHYRPPPCTYYAP
jgi:hypothetical protein